MFENRVSRYCHRFGLVAVVKTAVAGYAAVMALLLLVNLLGVDRLDVLIVMMLAGFGFLGLVVPMTAVLALDAHGSIAGTASALMGTLQFVTGALVMALVGMFVGPSVGANALPMVTGVALCALAALVLTHMTLRGPGDVSRAAQRA